LIEKTEGEKMHADRMLNESEYAETFEAVLDKKTGSRAGKLWQSGLLAGGSIALAAYGYLAAQASGAGKMGGALIFCAGLVLVVILQAELFTGNMILGVGAVGRRYAWSRVLRNWGWVYAANFVASIALALSLYIAGGVESSGELTDLGEIAAKVMHAKTSRTFSAYLIRGICCNLLVVGATVMALFARDLKGKVLAIVFPVTLFVLCGFEHSVANMFLLPFGFLVEKMPVQEWFGPLFRNLVPVTAGNILGGLIILFLQPRFVSMIRAQQKEYQENING
jgi:formate/nitrite transporter